MRDSHLTLPQQIHDDILCARYLDFQTVPRSFSGLLEPLPFMGRPPQPKVRQFHVDDKKNKKLDPLDQSGLIHRLSMELSVD